MMKGVAKVGDVSARASPSAAHPEAGSGQWEAGPIIETVHERIRVDGKPVLQEATCVFTFIGNIGSATSVMTVTASATGLRGTAGGVLLDGDADVDADGNRLAARTMRQRLRATV
jgi:hypothetical protein